MEKNNKIQGYIKEFYNMLEKYPDEPKEAFEFMAFLKRLLRCNFRNSIPTVEIMTLIKHHKPSIYAHLKKMSSNNLTLDILTGISMDLETATRFLDSIAKSDSEAV